MTRRLARRLAADRRGSPAVEFALVAPVMFMVTMGLADMAYQAFIQATLTGAVQKAGRDSTIQGAATSSATIDGQVERTILNILPTATFNAPASRRKRYDNYAATAGEPFVDASYTDPVSGKVTPPDGKCNHGETFTDLNTNGKYDIDPGTSGQGGANDVTRYTVVVTYPRLFPLGDLLNLGSTVTLSATTLLKNQPYASQTTSTATGTCP